MAKLFKFGGSYDVINLKLPVPPINNVIIEKQNVICYFYPKLRHKLTH